MAKKAGLIIMLLGVVLLLAALLLFLYHQQQAAAAGQAAEDLLSDLEGWMQTHGTPLAAPGPEESADRSAAAEAAPADSALSPEMPVVELDGYAYVGYVEIPVLELKLPVLSQWDDERLQIAPCRQHGSSRTDDLVIAAHNYKAHFGRLSALQAGDTVVFTDMAGIVNPYAVAKTDTLDPYDVDTVLNSEYDLVLYTCTVGGKDRVVVFCRRVTSEAR